MSNSLFLISYSVDKPNGTFLPDKNFIVVMGNVDRFEYKKNTLVFDISKIVKRVKIFNLTTYANDIAIILLNGSVPDKHPTVKPIVLNGGDLRTNLTCQATGWGYNEDVSATSISSV